MSDELLIKYMLNECNDVEGKEVEYWLGLSLENKKHYQQFKQVWDESKIAAEGYTEIDSNSSWLSLKQKLQKPRWQLNRTFYYAAASLLLLTGLFFAYNLSQKPAIPVISSNIQYPTNDTIMTTAASSMIDTLSDKSIVTLNKNTSLHYPKTFETNERRVKLNGEAFFSITPDKQKPFFIETPAAVEIRVVGTSFNVKAYDKYTEVIVESGIVELRKFSKVVLLHPNEKARIDKEDSTIVVEKNKDKLYKYYRSKEFECDNTPLWKVVEVLNDAYNDSVVIENNELRKLTITTRFDNESLEDILGVISETFDITVEKKGNMYILK